MKGYRTIAANIALATPLVADVLLPVLASGETRSLIPAEYMPWYSLALVVINMWLRFITTSPVFQKEPANEQ